MLRITKMRISVQVQEEIHTLDISILGNDVEDAAGGSGGGGGGMDAVGMVTVGATIATGVSCDDEDDGAIFDVLDAKINERKSLRKQWKS